MIDNKDRLSAKQMAAKLNRTERAIHHLLSKMQHRKQRVALLSNSYQPQKSPSEEMEELEDMIRPGILPTLARRFGVTHWAVYKRLHRNGVLIRESDGMLGVREVMRLYGCTQRRVYCLIDTGTLLTERTPTGYRIDPHSAEACAPLLRAPSKYDPRRRGRP